MYGHNILTTRKQCLLRYDTTRQVHPSWNSLSDPHMLIALRYPVYQKAIPTSPIDVDQEHFD